MASWAHFDTCSLSSLGGAVSMYILFLLLLLLFFFPLFSTFCLSFLLCVNLLLVVELFISFPFPSAVFASGCAFCELLVVQLGCVGWK